MTLAKKVLIQRNIHQPLLCLTVLFGIFSASVLAEQQAPPPELTSGTVAPVIVDGNKLFRVRGISSYPATKRAAEIRQRIIALANDKSFSTAQLTVTNEETDRSIVMAGNGELFNVFDEDAALENSKREVLATIYRDIVADAITAYRADRSTERLVNNSLLAVAATVLFAILLWASSRLLKWLVEWAETKCPSSGARSCQQDILHFSCQPALDPGRGLVAPVANGHLPGADLFLPETQFLDSIRGPGRSRAH